VLVLAFVAGCSGDSKPAAEPKAAAAPRPALTVRLTTPQTLDWPQSLPANGNVVAWQEAVIGPEIANYRITDVRVQVGDRVKKGQVLARIADDTVASEQAEAKAAVAELEASAAEAKANAERARDLREKGFTAPSSTPSTRRRSTRRRPGWPPARPACRRRRCAWARPPCWRPTTA
jgi:multidrug efflux pump subunit AcrA (membrane-fusion protein)